MEESADETPGLLLVRATIDELASQVQHLERSQDELREALKETPDDEDFLLALRENDEVICTKNDRIAELEDDLYKLDVAFRQEKASELRGFVIVPPSSPSRPQPQQLSQPPVQSPSLVPTVVPVVQVPTSNQPAAPTEDGLYL